MTYILSPLYLVCDFPCKIRIIKKRDAKYCCDIVSLCAIFSIVPIDGLTLPVSMTMAAVCNVKLFYIVARMGEGESWLSVYCIDIGKCNTVQITRDRVTFNLTCFIY